MYEIAVCDDDVAFASGLRAMLDDAFAERGAECRVSLFSDPSQLMNALRRGAGCDLIFQDILFGSEKGIRFARQLREGKWDVDLVFVTTSPEFAVMGYDVQPLNYLLKPVTPEKLSKVLDCFLERRTPQTLQLATPQGLLRIPTLEVLYFEIYSHTVIIHLTGGDSKALRGELNKLEAALPSNCFVRTHRSYLVNLAHIAEIERGQARLSTGEFVPISKSAYSNVLTSMITFDRRRRRPG